MPIHFAHSLSYLHCRAWCRLTVPRCHEHLHFTLLLYNWTAIIVWFIVVRYGFSFALFYSRSILLFNEVIFQSVTVLPLFYCRDANSIVPNILYCSPGTPRLQIPFQLPLISISHLRSHTTTHTQQLQIQKTQSKSIQTSARTRSPDHQTSVRTRSPRSTCLPLKASSPLRPSLLLPAQLTGIWSWPRLPHTVVPITALSRPTVQTSHAKPPATPVEQSQTWPSALHKSSLSQAGLPMAVDHVRCP